MKAFRRGPVQAQIRRIARQTAMGVMGAFPLLATTPTYGADVVLRLESVEVGPCSWWDVGLCGVDRALALDPLTPMGSGMLSFDALGAFQGGALTLESHTRDGVAVAGWTRALDPQDLQASDGVLDPGDIWVDVAIVDLSFENPVSFSGRITHSWAEISASGGGVFVLERYAFSTTPGPPPPSPPDPCLDARAHTDLDMDGEEDSLRLPLFAFERARVHSLEGEYAAARRALDRAFQAGFRTTWAIDLRPQSFLYIDPIQQDPSFAGMRSDYATWIARIGSENARRRGAGSVAVAP